MGKIILPPVDGVFEWRTLPAGPVLVCRALEPYASHLFTTRPWRLGASTSAVEDGDAWADVAQAVGVAAGELIRVRQVHGTAVHVARPAGDATALHTADIVVAESGRVAVAVQSADCAPLLIADMRTRAVAAAHAGWRGLAAGVPRAVIAAMAETFGSRARDLVVAVGPSIGACCYEVGGDVPDAFAAAGFPRDELAGWFHAEPLPPHAHARLRPQPIRPDHCFFDGWRSARDQLAAAGVPVDQILGCDVCTAGFPEIACSYRRDGAPAGRMAAVIRPLTKPSAEESALPAAARST